MELETNADNGRTDGAAAFTKSGLARGLRDEVEQPNRVPMLTKSSSKRKPMAR
jgi:hypothetical protein